MPGGHPGGNRCLGESLTAYADRAMPDAVLLRWDRHLVACTRCRAAVEEERRVLAALRSPSVSCVPGDLRSMLLAVAAEPGVLPGTPDPSSARRHPVVSPIPVAPVPVVDRAMPAMHRSVRRATVFAGIAAGATAAAAWSIAVTAAPTASPTQPSAPAVQGVSPVTRGYTNASFTVRGLGNPAVAPPSATTTVAPAVVHPRQRSAQSTP
jgi:hypothetical protein